MRRFWGVGLVCVMMVACGSPVFALAAPAGRSECGLRFPATQAAIAPPSNDEGISRTTVEEMAAGQFAAAEKGFTATLAQSVDEETLEMAWMQVEKRFGVFQQIAGTSVEEQQGQKVVRVACAFAKSPVAIQFTFDAQGKISNLHFQAAPGS